MFVHVCVRARDVSKKDRERENTSRGGHLWVNRLREKRRKKKAVKERKKEKTK